MIKKIILEDLISKLGAFDEELNVIFPNSKDLSLKTVCFLLCDKELENNLPNDYYYVFGLYSLVDIVENLKIQTNNEFKSYQLIEAINHYIKNDAFIELK